MHFEDTVIVADEDDAYVIIPLSTADKIDAILVKGDYANVYYMWSTTVPSPDSPDWTEITPDEHGYVYGEWTRPGDKYILFIKVTMYKDYRLYKVLARGVYGTVDTVTPAQDVKEVDTSNIYNLLQLTIHTNATPDPSKIIYRVFIDVDGDPSTGYKGESWMEEWEYGAYPGVRGFGYVRFDRRPAQPGHYLVGNGGR